MVRRQLCLDRNLNLGSALVLALAACAALDRMTLSAVGGECVLSPRIWFGARSAHVQLVGDKKQNARNSNWFPPV